MLLLVLNAGSGSQRATLFDLPRGPLPDEPLAPVVEIFFDTTAPGQPPGKILLHLRRPASAEATVTAEIDAAAPLEERLRAVLRLLHSGVDAPLASPRDLAAIAHRVVHGGPDFDRAVRIDAAVERAIERWSAAAPLHNPANLAGLHVARAFAGDDVPQFAVFDTAFHRTLPPAAAAYAGPHAWIERGLVRYGFHGTNFRWVAGRAAQLLGRRDDPALALVLCHLGGGCSLCATRGGRSLDTTMGFTPLDGLAMCTRSGAVDPGLLLHLLRCGATTDELEQTLNKHSGLLGLSGVSGDTRVLTPRAAAGDARARLALDVFVHRLRASLGAMIAALGRAPDAIVFTDAIGEDEPPLRAAACEAFRFLGVELDPARNATSPLDADLATPGSRVRVLLVASREAWQIARECHPLLRGPDSSRPAAPAVDATSGANPP